MRVGLALAAAALALAAALTWLARAGDPTRVGPPAGQPAPAGGQAPATPGPRSATSPAPAAPSGTPRPASPPAVLLAAGDIADCAGAADDTGRLLRRHDGVVAPLGDLAYPDGSAARFADCYDPTWGHARDRTRPAQGNHDVLTPGAAGYFGYFGGAAGPQPRGYYSYRLGAWHAVALNSNCAPAGGCGPDDPQGRWLRADLAAAGTPNILAYWHHPRFSSGRHGDDPRSAAFWDILADGGADLILNGHDHDYQRFAPLDADGAPDPQGIRQFVVGTGGAWLRPFPGPAPAEVEFRSSDHHGLLRLELGACGYAWRFVATDGTTVDSGQQAGTCSDGPASAGREPGPG